MTASDHISICLCTFKRPDRLRALLGTLADQQTNGRFTYSLVVVDNDKSASARDTVESCAKAAGLDVLYDVEPREGIAAARNRSVVNARGNLLAFIDDDELPGRQWLLALYDALCRFDATGVHGPVTPVFEGTPPRWMVKSGLFERPAYATGAPIDWRLAGMGNVLLRREAMDEIAGPFDVSLAMGGEDTEFFRRSVELGRLYVWCNEAEVVEAVPEERTRLSFQLRRALLRGKVSVSGHSGGASGVLKSLVASIAYTTLLPVFFLMGRHVFVAYLVRDFDHIGKLLAVCGVDVIGNKYIAN